MKTFLALIALVGSPLIGLNPIAQAADISDNDLDLDFDPAASESSGAQQNQNSAPSDSSIRSATRQNRSIYIVNQATSGAKNQTETDTKASNSSSTKATTLNSADSSETTLMELRAEQVRRNRQRAERETEAMANARIEESRLKDEERRHNALFGDRLRDSDDEGSKSRTKEATQVQSQSLIQVIQPAPIQEPAEKKVSRENRESFDHHEQEEEHKSFSDSNLMKHFQGSQNYVTGFIGITEFPKAANIQGEGAFGIGLGTELKNHVRVEALFQYGSYIKPYGTGDSRASIDEYTGLGALKIPFNLKGDIRPYVGGLMSYSYRTYLNEPGPMGSFTSSAGGEANSSALDVGALGGAELAINSDFALGLEFRYLWNLTSKTPDLYQFGIPNEKPMDEYSHYNLGLTGRFTF